MSATVMREKRQTTLPVEVVEAAGLKPNDQVEWRFQDGEIRGRKLVPVSAPRTVRAKLVRRAGRLVFEAKGVKITADAIARAVREERDSR